MKTRYVTTALLALASCATSTNQAQSQTASTAKPQECLVRVSGIQYRCPIGWNIVYVNEMLGVTIGDYVRADGENRLTLYSGHASIMLQPKPDFVPNIKQFMSRAALDPDNVQSTKTLPNKLLGQIKVTAFSGDIKNSNWTSTAYYFEFNGTPLCLGVTYERSSKKASEYIATLDSIVANLEPVGAKPK